MMHTYQKSAIVGRILTEIHHGRRPDAEEIVNAENLCDISPADYLEQLSYTKDRINAYMADAVATKS